MLGDKVQIECHSSIKILGSKTIYFDPYKVSKNYNDADYIFLTHTHYDHLSPKDIKKVINDETKIVATLDAKEELLKLVSSEKIMLVEPGKKYTIDSINFETTYAYNKIKPFHPKSNKWVGYLVTLDKIIYYVAGGTDNIPEMHDIVCDVAMIPIGGTYTMNYKKAAELANCLNAEVIIPTHYGKIVGDLKDGEKFANLVKNKTVKVLIK